MVLSCPCRRICCRPNSGLSTNYSCTYHYSSTNNHCSTNNRCCTHNQYSCTNYNPAYYYWLCQC